MIPSFLTPKPKDSKSESQDSSARHAEPAVKDNELDEKSQSEKPNRHVGLRGSALYRNDERNDLLRKLFVKRRMMERIHFQMTTATAAPKPLPSSEISDLTEDSILGKYDESMLRECRAEVRQEMDKEIESAKIEELKSITKEYLPLVEYEYPLEVRMKNVTYTVPISEASNQIKTVYNSSLAYSTSQYVKGLWKGEQRQKKAVTSKNIITDINLVLKPGKQYLILGPPGSGKSTLLKAISSHLHPGKKDTLSGSIAYNGRTLEVRSCCCMFDSFIHS
jgi:ABC-type multidrug transport system fused ATPase/permease subunit